MTAAPPLIAFAHVGKSFDGGRAWRGPVTLPATRFGRPWYVSEIEAIVVDPKHNQRLFAATDLGVFRSDDGGESWRGVNDGFDADAGAISAIVLDPSTRRLYVGTLDSGVWQLDLDDPPARHRAAR